MALIDLARNIVPFPVRVELMRLRRWPRWVVERRQYARGRAGSLDSFKYALSTHESPLRREGVADDNLQKGKEKNVDLAAKKLNMVVVEPGATLSYHSLVGRPSRLRGFGYGLELKDGKLDRGMGGGCCQVSNMLYLLAIRAGLEIVERHRHALDLFPDHGRTVPFGCGATVFYNNADLKIKNPWPFAVVVNFRIENGNLVGEIRAKDNPGQSIEIYETDHIFRREGKSWYRENHVRRRYSDAKGEVVKDEEIAHNIGRCLYDPENPT